MQNAKLKEIDETIISVWFAQLHVDAHSLSAILALFWSITDTRNRIRILCKIRDEQKLIAAEDAN